VPATSILLLETDTTARNVIRTALTRAGYTVTSVADVQSALRAAPEHQIVIIDILGPGRSAADACREIHATPGLGAMPVLGITQTDDVEERIRFLEAGADDVIARPFDARELEARLEALLLRFNRSRDVSPAAAPAVTPDQHRARRVVAVFSPKGGVGTTTIAVNMAIVANQLNPGRALILDLDMPFGAVATHLDLPINNSVVDLARDEEALRDPELLRSYVATHENGLQCIGGAGSPEYAQLVTPKHVERLLATLSAAYDVVLIDAGSTLDERTMAVFEAAECIVVPILAELGGLRAVRTMVDYLNEIGSTMSRAVFVLNNMFPKAPLRTGDVETALGAKIAIELPYDPLVYMKAINEGVPVIVGAPKSPAAERLTALAELALAPNRSAKDLGQPDRRRGIGGLLRRSA
jgi:pilus assembly protein CpaE